MNKGDIVEICRPEQRGAAVPERWIPAQVIDVGATSLTVEALRGLFDDEYRAMSAERLALKDIDRTWRSK